jgi:hypothetical protein
MTEMNMRKVLQVQLAVRIALVVVAIVFAMALVLTLIGATARADSGSGPFIEGCQWNQAADAWVYGDGSLCRGTGEDPNGGRLSLLDYPLRAETPQVRNPAGGNI